MIHDIDEFEASYSDENGGCYFIAKADHDRIRIPRLEEDQRVLHCDFEILKDNFSDEDIAELVFIVLLHRYCRDGFHEKIDFVEFNNLQTTKQWTLAYVF